MWSKQRCCAENPSVNHALPAGEDRERPEESGPQPAAVSGTGPCPSITGLHNSQAEVNRPDEEGGARAIVVCPRQEDGDTEGSQGAGSSNDVFANAVAAIDWIEIAGLVSWDEHHGEQLFWTLDELQKLARENGCSQPYVLADQEVMLQPHGFGKGSEARMPYRFDFDEVMLGIARRPGEERNLANLQIKIPGEACVIRGAESVLKLATEMVAELGGTIWDSWVRRIDVCLDVPELDINDWLVPTFLNRQFKSTAKKWRPNDGPGGVQGIEIGSHKSRRLIIYDKRKEYAKKSELYQRAMIDYRWGGNIPEAATRIEYSVRRSWLHEHKLHTTEEVLKRLPDVIKNLTRTDWRPFYCVTQQVPDRENGHQCRTTPHSEWLKLVRTMRRCVGSPAEPLQRISRGELKCGKATRSVIGYLTSAAANMGAEVTTVDGLKQFLGDLAERNGITDEDVHSSWKKKAHEKGTYREAGEFQFGANAKGGGQ